MTKKRFRAMIYTYRNSSRYIQWDRGAFPISSRSGWVRQPVFTEACLPGHRTVKGENCRRFLRRRRRNLVRSPKQEAYCHPVFMGGELSVYTILPFRQIEAIFPEAGRLHLYYSTQLAGLQAGFLYFFNFMHLQRRHSIWHFRKRFFSPEPLPLW